ncbi:hypothetical protein HDV00_001145 [Rhizophlyctis rosea]|nr:hypothetical protein HDV00_001145 [Rhizophlyctis rosea]
MSTADLSKDGVPTDPAVVDHINPATSDDGTINNPTTLPPSADSKPPNPTTHTIEMEDHPHRLTRQTRSLPTRLLEITKDYAPLPFITFGGPAAHIGLLHNMFVTKKKWMDDTMFAELFAISSALPGPASTQLAYTVAMIRDGIIPAVWGFMIWSIPGGIVMGVLGGVIGGDQSTFPVWVLFLENGLASAAVALVAVAAYNLGNKLCIDPLTKVIAFATFALTANFQAVPWLIPLLMVVGALVGYAEHWILAWRKRRNDGQLLHTDQPATSTSTPTAPAPPTTTTPSTDPEPPVHFAYTPRTGLLVLITWLILFLAAVLVRAFLPITGLPVLTLQVLTTFYYVGSIIFGGGPVVIPMLYNYVVTNGWATDSAFLLGLAIINAMPGPNFNFAAFCGALILRPYGVGPAVGGAILAWIGMFLPGLLIKTGVLPLWRKYRGFPTVRLFFRGANAAAVGLVFTATYLLWEKAIAVSVNGDGMLVKGASEVGRNALYVAVVGAVFVGVGLLKVPSPVGVAVGGVVGLLDFAVHRNYRLAA